MTKSELISILAKNSANLPGRDVELAIKCILEQMSQALAANKRIEIRGFGSFSLHFRPPRVGRNPKTGESVNLDGKYVPHFKPGKDLRERVNKLFHFQKVESFIENTINGDSAVVVEPQLEIGANVSSNVTSAEHGHPSII